jgi:hypothetical protein
VVVGATVVVVGTGVVVVGTKDVVEMDGTVVVDDVAEVQDPSRATAAGAMSLPGRTN